MKTETNGARLGRPTKYCPAVVQVICDMVARGLNYAQAADAAGIHRDTLAEWESNKPAFSDALKRAKAQGISRRLARIEKAAANGSWQADAWWLERNCPEQWGRKLAVALPEAKPESEPEPDDMDHIERVLRDSYRRKDLAAIERDPNVTKEQKAIMRKLMDELDQKDKAERLRAESRPDKTSSE